MDKSTTPAPAVHHATDTTRGGLCPTWCTLPASHLTIDGCAVEPDLTIVCTHEREIATVPLNTAGRTGTVAMSSCDRIDAGGTLLERLPPLVDVYVDDGLTAAQARELAAALLAAADAVDEATS